MIKLVVIDDDELIRTSLRLLLREAGFFVAGEAHDGASGLAMVNHLRPDVVCLDVQMPEMNGMDVLEKIRATLPEIAVLMITSTSDRETVNQALALGAAGFVVKPFNADRVVKSIRAAYKSRQSSLAAECVRPTVDGQSLAGAA